mmetsp:Transcript_118404/g.205669  ORF Transcript_118404/g.205669 Transcript_118404/m.205669 type:complete len:219 (+) Transcript_118404:29-685(+)
MKAVRSRIHRTRLAASCSRSKCNLHALGEFTKLKPPLQNALAKCEVPLPLQPQEPDRQSRPKIRTVVWGFSLPPAAPARRPRRSRRRPSLQRRRCPRARQRRQCQSHPGQRCPQLLQGPQEVCTDSPTTARTHASRSPESASEVAAELQSMAPAVASWSLQDEAGSGQTLDKKFQSQRNQEAQHAHLSVTPRPTQPSTTWPNSAARGPRQRGGEPPQR